MNVSCTTSSLAARSRRRLSTNASNRPSNRSINCRQASALPARTCRTRRVSVSVTAMGQVCLATDLALPDSVLASIVPIAEAVCLSSPALPIKTCVMKQSADLFHREQERENRGQTETRPIRRPYGRGSPPKPPRRLQPASAGDWCSSPWSPRRRECSRKARPGRSRRTPTLRQADKSSPNQLPVIDLDQGRTALRGHVDR